MSLVRLLVSGLEQDPKMQIFLSGVFLDQLRYYYLRPGSCLFQYGRSGVRFSYVAKG